MHSLSQPRTLNSQNGERLDQIFNLEKYHKRGIKGRGVKIAIFDSGLSDIYSENQDTLLRVKKIINFTHDKSTHD